MSSCQRLDADLHAALKIIGEFQQHNDVILGLNEAESLHVAKVLRLKKTPNNPKGAASLAAAIREKAGASHRGHPSRAVRGGCRCAGRVLRQRPVHGQAEDQHRRGRSLQRGFVVGRLLGLGVAHSLQLASRPRASTSATPSARIANSSCGFCRPL